MKIGINGLAATKGGGVTYLQNLVSSILEISEHEIHIFVSSEARRRFNLPVEMEALTVEPIEISGIIERLWFEQIRIPRRIISENIDILYSPSEIPVLWCACTQIVANQNPNLYYSISVEKPLQQRVRERVLSKALEVSQFVSEATIFVTESSKRKAIRELHLTEDDSYSVHHGVDSAFTTQPTNKAVDLPDESEYILLVSTVYKHKNIHKLIAAYAQLPPEKRREHPLIIVGDKTVEIEHTNELKRLVTELGVTETVSFVGRVPSSAVRSYYKNAHLFVFPSLIESFGLPILEAMAAGVPVVASANAAIPEVGGDAALYFDPEDPDQMSVILERALDDSKMRDNLIKKGRERVKEFTWEKSARETLNIFENVADSNGDLQRL